MKKLDLGILFALIMAVVSGFAQTMTITSPSLTVPYQVTSGTVVTFEWDAFGSAPNAIFTYSSAPSQSIINSGFPPSASWTQHTNFTGPVLGKYHISLTITSDTWVWGGLSGFIGWSYSNILPIQVISAMTITASDSMICPTAGNVLFTAPTGTGYTYQWYKDTTAITGATSSTYSATTAGSYYCIVNNGSPNTTNTLTINNYPASFTGSLSNNQVTMLADQTFTSYQWYERIGTGSAAAISGATSNQYIATVTSTLKHYYFEGTINGCTVAATEKPVIDTMFVAPSVTLNAIPNSQGNLCAGSPISITATKGQASYQWYKNGVASYSTDSINLFGSYQNGTWYVESQVASWPNILLQSNSVSVTIIDLIAPNITGANYYDKFCTGDIIPFILTDEGYTYTWYVHDTAQVYNASHIISVPTGVYQHTYTGNKYVTIVAEFGGCEKITSQYIQGWANYNLPVSMDNYDQSYLCADSSVNLFVPTYVLTDFNTLQWHQKISGTWSPMVNETLAVLNVQNPGIYKVTAIPNSCSGASVSSLERQIYSYLDRQPSIYAYDTTMCQGETLTLYLAGATSWYAEQWLESDINIGSGGYTRSYTGMLTNSASDTQNVTQFSSYQVSVKHISCPNGLKVKSNILFIKPTVHPEILLVDSMAIEPRHVIDWDSVNHFIGCQNQPVRLTLTNTNYPSITWYTQLYAGDDDYAWGTQSGTGDTLSELMDAKFITAVVTDSTGCIGQTTPVLLDSRVFQSPAITSYNNSELCEPGDSVLFHLAFPGTWIKYEWYRDGAYIPNSDNDTLWAKLPGMYTISGYPADCPTFEYSSGVGPVAKFLYAEILENDSLLYAMPELGFYTYQWFFNGDSIDPPNPLLPWVFAKDSLQPGVYTVAVSNNNCTKLSLGYVVSPNGVFSVDNEGFSIFPNPTNSVIYLRSETENRISEVIIFDVQGREVLHQYNYDGRALDLNSFQNGMYLVRIISETGETQTSKILKQ